MKTYLLPLVPVVAALRLLASPGAAEGYVAHEWGTFTSVQGADGRQLIWNPLSVSELPGFVYNKSNTPETRLEDMLGKESYSALQRMETPVIYFYADKPQTVDVDVQFPRGIVTEWYPQARLLTRDAKGRPLPRNHIEWDDVKLLPKADATALPSDSSGSHYFAARGPEANKLQVTNSKKQVETEKFLFYRGIGNFRAPLTVTTADEAKTLTVKNDGEETLGHLFVFQFRDGRGSFQSLLSLKSGENRTVDLTEPQQFVDRNELIPDIRRDLEHALVDEGLFPAEAAAMVATWDDSWFTESGVRVLYTLPTAWTDQILPLKLTPSPRSVARVFVGRAEVITPAMEFSLLRELMRYHEGNQAVRASAVKSVRALSLGRFAAPTLTRVLASVPADREFRDHSWELLQASLRPEAKEVSAVPLPSYLKP